MTKRSYFGICTLLLMVFALAITSQAATITVINNNDSGTGSLRRAILNANPGDTITFAANVTGSIFLASSLDINKNLTIDGPGANVLGIEGRASPTETNVFWISGGNVTISGLAIANGFTSGAGGGVVIEGGNLTLNNCLIIGNSAESAGGVIVSGGSILTIRNSTITGNTSFVEGGGVSNRGGTLVMINSTVYGNNAQEGGGIAAGIFANGTTTTILNSTIANNTGDGGGLKIGASSVVNIKNTIVAGNTGSNPDVGGTVNTQGGNLIGNTTGSSGFNAASDLLNVNPLLGGLANNGGTLSTVSLLSGSPAIDAGNNTGAPTTDQRGVARPQNGTVDIGSFESGVTAWTGQTNVGSNVNAILGTVAITFFGVSTAGTTTQVSIDPSGAGTLLPDYSFGPGYPAYDISTTASYTAPITVCLQVPGVTDVTIFNGLALLHNEGGVLVDHTVFRDFATKTICANVSSLSPFAVADDLTPSAASVSVGGRVLTAKGRGISKVNVTLTDAAGMTRSVLTNAFGYYRFDDVAAGQIYMISIRSKSYHFANPTQVVTVDDEIADLDFIATPLEALRSQHSYFPGGGHSQPDHGTGRRESLEKRLEH